MGTGQLLSLGAQPAPSAGFSFPPPHTCFARARSVMESPEQEAEQCALLTLGLPSFPARGDSVATAPRDWPALLCPRVRALTVMESLAWQGGDRTTSSQQCLCPGVSGGDPSAGKSGAADSRAQEGARHSELRARDA